MTPATQHPMSSEFGGKLETEVSQWEWSILTLGSFWLCAVYGLQREAKETKNIANEHRALTGIEPKTVELTTKHCLYNLSVHPIFNSFIII